MKKGTPEHFNESAISKKSKPSEIIDSLEISEDMHIADVGSGGGFFTIKFAKKASKGKVYAIDIDEYNLKYIENSAKKMGVTNLEIVLADENGVKLPENSIDLIFSRNTYHHIPNPSDYFLKLKPFLKPDGRLAIIDYKKMFRLNFVRIFGHYTPAEKIKEDMERAGYRFVRSFGFLRKQSFFIFQNS